MSDTPAESKYITKEEVEYIGGHHLWISNGVAFWDHLKCDGINLNVFHLNCIHFTNENQNKTVGAVLYLPANKHSQSGPNILKLVSPKELPQDLFSYFLFILGKKY